jgi:hypothetical protein
MDFRGQVGGQDQGQNAKSGIMSRFDDHWSVLQLLISCNLLSGAMFGHQEKGMPLFDLEGLVVGQYKCRFCCSPECKELKSVSPMLISCSYL